MLLYEKEMSRIFDLQKTIFRFIFVDFGLNHFFSKSFSIDIQSAADLQYE
jgi:hypothetical protein